MRRRAGPVAALAALALAALAPAAGAAVPGTIKFAGCVRDTAARTSGDRCTSARALASTAFLAISPDGRNVYATSRGSAAVAIFSRNRRTGALRQLSRTTGCISDPATAGCAGGRGLAVAWGVVVSPDGRNVYVTGRDADAVTTFRRSASTGALTQTGCVLDADAPARAGCTATPGLDGATDVTVSADGHQVYVASLDGNALVTFARDPATGALTPQGCLRDPSSPLAGCTGAHGLGGARSVALAPDGRNLYVAATTDSLSAVTTFARATDTGALTFVGCLSGDGADHYDSACTQISGLSFDQFVRVSPDGRQVYATATNTEALLTLRRLPDGSLVQDATPDSCLADFDQGTEKCTGVAGLAQPLAVAFAAGGRQAFTAEFGYGTVFSWERTPASGRLSQLGPCLSSENTDCELHPSLQRAGYLAVAPDERHLYVNAPVSSAVTVVARAYAPVRVALPASRVAFHAGRARVAVRCPATAGRVGCMGGLRVVVVRRIPVPTARTVASGAFDIAAGATAQVTLVLSASAVRKAGVGRRFAAVLAAAAVDATGAHRATGQRPATVTR